MSTAVTTPATEMPPGKSVFERLIGVFMSPGETFADIARKPDWIAPMVVLMLASVAGAEVFLAKIGLERVIRAGLEHSSRAQQMTPEQIDQAVQQGVKIGTYFAHAGFIFMPIFLIIVAAVGMAIASGIFGHSVGFKTALSVTAYANVVTVLGSLIGIAMMVFGDPEHFNAQSPIPTNPGFFMDPSASKPLLSLATSLDLFTLWFMALLGIGFSAATMKKVKTSSMFLVFFGIWIVIVLAKMGWATLGS